MIPGQYDLQIYQGDTYYGPLITLPDLSPFGGPSDLDSATVTAQIRSKEASTSALATFTVQEVDSDARQIRCTLAPGATASIVAKRGVWDLQVSSGGWTGTILKGKVEFMREVTR